MQLQRPERKIKFILNDDQIRLGPDLQLLDQIPHRAATQVHERFWLCQDDRLIADCRPGSQRPALPVSDFHIQFGGQPINGEEPQIVRRQLVFLARIAKPNYQLHVRRRSLVVGRWQNPAPALWCWPTTHDQRPTTFFFTSSLSFRASPPVPRRLLPLPACPS